MARIRTIKPSFFMSRAVRRLPDREKLVWAGLWPNADDEGRLLDEPGILVGLLWALNLTADEIDEALSRLASEGRIIRYEVAGERYIQVTGWEEHQKINRPSASEYPPPPLTEGSVKAHGVLMEGSRQEGKGRERKGGEAPSPFCPEHPRGTRSACKACGDARMAFKAWERQQKSAPALPRIVRKGDGHPCKADEHGFCVHCQERVT